jgi:hypothetical protein
LSYFNARYYDSDTGRFISPDPTVPDPNNSQMYNRYMFVGGNPIMFQDIDGYQDSTASSNETVEDVATSGNDVDTGDGGSETEDSSTSDNNQTQPTSTEPSSESSTIDETNSTEDNTDQEVKPDGYIVKKRSIIFQVQIKVDKDGKVTVTVGDKVSQTPVQEISTEPSIEAARETVKEDLETSSAATERADEVIREKVQEVLSEDSVKSPIEVDIRVDYSSVNHQKKQVHIDNLNNKVRPPGSYDTSIPVITREIYEQ